MPATTLTQPPRATGPWRHPAFRLALLSLAAAVALGVSLGPRLLQPGVGSAATPGPTFNVPAAMTAQVDMAGETRTGDLWAAQGSYLLISGDKGVEWHAGNLHTPFAAIYVLDRLHAWTIEAVEDGSGLAPGLPSAGLVVWRTTDAGYVWQNASIADASCRAADLAFADADRGFLLCLGATPTAPDSVYRTDDGGATWSLAGRASGLGAMFAVSDAQTLWSAPDSSASQTGGVFLSVSRDAGATWTRAVLPEADSLNQPGAGASTAAGPVFWDSSNGAFAVNVQRTRGTASPSTWFYRTSDGGRSWTLIERAAAYPALGQGVSAVVGPTWAVPGAHLRDLEISSDFGATWTETTASGMPDNQVWLWLGFSDANHGAGIVFVHAGAKALLITSDGGRTWSPADFGDARTHVQADPDLDVRTANKIAGDFAMFASKDPATAWNMLSSYSQRQFGTEPAFEMSEAALAKRTGYAAQVGEATRRDGLEPVSGVWADVGTFADLSRTYIVVVSYPGTNEPARKLVVAPTTITGEWRVWLVPPE